MSDLEARSLQERYAPGSVCFGCGPANRDGLGLRSFPDPHQTDGLVARWMPSPHHHAFANVLNGGIIGVLMDCHANWAAAMAIMRASGRDRPPPTVTARYEVKLLAPTLVDAPLTIRSWPVSIDGRQATSEARIETADGAISATFVGRFVVVRDEHPAHEPWQPGESPTPGAG